jgi:hypothetical protein
VAVVLCSMQCGSEGSGTDGKRPRPILVKCKSSSSAGEILRCRSSLKDSEFAGVYLNPDRASCQNTFAVVHGTPERLLQAWGLVAGFCHCKVLVLA